MSATARADALLPAGRPAPRVPNALLGTILFLLSEAMFFAGLVFVTLSFRRAAAVWPPAGVGQPSTALLVANTVALLASSLAVAAATRAVRRGAPAALRRWLRAATALGALFVVGQLAQFTAMGGWRPAEGMYRTLFQVVAGLHGLHVAAGVLLLGLALTRAGEWTPRRHLPVRLAELYWHFVVLVWLPLLAVLVVA